MFDVTKQQLSDQGAAHLYCDKQGQFFLDTKQGYLADVNRWVTNLLGIREYRLEKIVSRFAGTMRQTEAGKANLDFLCKKLAKSCGIDEETYQTMLIAEDLLGHKSLQPAQKQIGEDFFKALVSSNDLQRKLISFQGKLSTDLEEAKRLQTVLERVQLTNRWTELGLDAELLKNDYDGARFLIKNRLVYSIVGFQNSSADGPSKHEIRVNDKQQLCVKQQGVYVPVAEIAKKLTFNKDWQELMSKENPDERWNYFSPDGLVPVDRWLHKELVPIETLSKEEVQKLLAHAETFYPEGQKPAGVNHEAVVQIFTNPRKTLGAASDFPLLSRLDASFPVHAAIRIITKDGLVYSTGFGSTVEEDVYTEGNMLASINGMPTVLDYEEFRKHEGRIVTSIPVTSAACGEMLQTLQKYREDTIRFNLVKQNCVQLAVDTLAPAGVKINNYVKAREFVRGIFPSTEQIPVIGPVVAKAHRTVEDLTDYAQSDEKIKKPTDIFKKIIGFGTLVVTYVPSRLLTVFCNLVILGMGGGSGSPLPDDEAESVERFQVFSKLVKNPLDIFKESTSMISHALPLIQWQLQQRSTAVHLYGTKPEMGILPPEPNEAIEKRRAYFEIKYLSNFGITRPSSSS